MGRPPKATKRELSDIKVKEETTTTPEPESDLKMKSSPKLPSELGSAKEIYSSALTESHVPAVSINSLWDFNNANIWLSRNIGRTLGRAFTIKSGQLSMGSNF